MEMQEYSRYEEDTMQPNEGETQQGPDDSFACTRSGFEVSAGIAQESNPEESSGDSGRQTDNLNFKDEGATPRHGEDHLPPPPPIKRVEYQIPSHLFPAMKE